ncbi:hypothetical protein AAC387_Pa02g3884 [Persea americana]
MATPLRQFYAFFLLFIFGKGLCQPCDVSSIMVNQTAIGDAVHGLQEYQVIITNKCICTQTDVEFQCTGFDSVEHVDPSIFRGDGEYCIIDHAQPIWFGSSINFTYPSKAQIRFVPASSQINCS